MGLNKRLIIKVIAIKRFLVRFTMLNLYALTILFATSNNALSHHRDPDINDDLLYISDEIKASLDSEIRPIRDSVQRALALHSLMFHERGWNIDYDAERTYNALETFEHGVGNCMSMAALFVAAARYVDLPAKFQSVTVPDSWTPKTGYYLLTGHVNASIRLPKKTIHIEFLRAFYDVDLIEVKKKRMSDDRAFAEFYNNVGMELVDQKKFKLAEQYMDLALNLDSKIDFIWSNYGVLHKFKGEKILAEQKYRQALRLNKRNFSALTNLYILLGEQNRLEEAQEIALKVERYSKNNPYHLAKLADKAYRSNKLKDALLFIKKALRKDKNVPAFHHAKANILYASGDVEGALSALHSAREISEKNANDEDIALYQKKIQSLISTTESY